MGTLPRRELVGRSGEVDAGPGVVRLHVASLGEPLTSALAEGRHAGLLDAGMTAMQAGQHPRIAVFEDVHWADELILDLLGFLARKIETPRLLVVATYRDDEIGGAHPTRVLLGDIGRLPGVAQVKVPRSLTPQEVPLSSVTCARPSTTARRVGR